MNENNTSNNLNGQVLGSVNPTPNQEVVNPGVVPPVESVQPTPEAVNNSSVMVGNVGTPTPEVTPVTPEVAPVTPEVTPATPEAAPNPTPVAEPVNYTNTQVINTVPGTPTPMPGFDNPNVVGTTPPQAPETEAPKKKNNKKMFIAIIVVLLLLVAGATYFILNKSKIINNNTELTITTKGLEINAGDTLSEDINDFATISGDVRNCSLDTSNVKTDVAGTYEYTITCGEKIKTGTVTVHDDGALAVELKTVFKIKGSTIEAKEFAVNPEYSYEFVDIAEAEKISTYDIGTYTLKVKASFNGKNATKEGKVVILASAVKGNLVCTSKEQAVSDPASAMTVTDKLAIVDDGQNGYGNYGEQVYTYKFTDEAVYKTTVGKIANGKLTIGDVTGVADYNNEDKTITITLDINNDELKSKYGEDNIKDYGSINSYYTGTLGYSCEYQKSN